MHLADSATRPDLSLALAGVEVEVRDFFSSLAPEEYLLRVNAAWSPAEHLEHLNIAVRTVARVFRVPHWILRLAFGRPSRASASYDAVRERYQGVLARGGRAGGRFVPPRGSMSPLEVEERRRESLERWRIHNERLRAALARWTERELDGIRLPHPLLGGVTAREMLYFTVYHHQHHINGAKRRLPRFADPAT